MRKATTAICATLSRSRLPRYFNGQEQIGVSLTGGLDTRIIMAWRKALPARCPAIRSAACTARTRTCIWHGAWQKSAASPIRSLPSTATCLSKFPHYAERTLYLTDGCVDISRSAGPLQQRNGSPDCAGADGRNIRQRDYPRGGHVQGGDAFAGNFSPEVLATGIARRAEDISRSIARQPDERSGIPPAGGVSFRRADAGTDAADASCTLLGQ